MNVTPWDQPDPYQGPEFMHVAFGLLMDEVLTKFDMELKQSETVRLVELYRVANEGKLCVTM